MLIDTHCHLNDPSFDSTLQDVMARAQAAGVDTFIVPAYDMGSLRRTAGLAAFYPDVIHPAFGIHPWYVSGAVDYDEVFFFLKQKNPVAVGEIGIDLSPECPSERIQTEAIILQLGFARELDLPVIIHCRKAHELLYEILKSCDGKIRGVMHSFSGSKGLMFRFIDLGFCISFSGSVTRRTAKKYHKNAEGVPIDRLLLETDAPSIATESTDASEVEPRHTVEVARKVAEIRNMSFEDVCTISTENARRLFNLPA